MIFTGIVRPGRGLGKRLGCATANVALPHPPPRTTWGVYACRVTMPEGESRNGVAHLGPAVAVGDRVPTLEVHVLDFTGDLVSQTLTVDLLERLRPTQDFPTVELLAAQIAKDVTAARKYFAR